jgi:hypothetical protein
VLKSQKSVDPETALRENAAAPFKVMAQAKVVEPPSLFPPVNCA